MLKVIHSADWHYKDSDHDEIEKCVDFMIEKAREEKPDLIVVSGDITDSQNLKLDSRSAKTICRQFSELADIAPVVNIIGTPSHDGKSAEILRFVKGKYQIHVSEKPEQLHLSNGQLFVVEDFDITVAPYPLDAVITQIPTPTKQFFQADSAIEEGDKAIANAMTAIFGRFGAAARKFACPHIINGHFQVGGAFISEKQQLIGRDIEISTDQMAMASAHVTCLGHIHLQQRMKDNIYYAGSIYRKTFGETEEKGFYIHEIDGLITKSLFIETPTVKKLTIREDFTKEENFAELDAVLYSYGPDDLKDAHVKVEFKIWQDEQSINKVNIEEFLKTGGAEHVIVNLIRIPRETVRAANVLKLSSLRDKIQEMAALRLEEIDIEVLRKADLLESSSPDELLQVVKGVN